MTAQPASLGINVTAADIEALGRDVKPVRILPDVTVLKIGGQSIMDRGRTAVYPLLDEIVENRKDHRLILGTGGGTRSRHAYSLAVDLDMPTGVIAKLGASISRQNARMLGMLLTSRGGVLFEKEQFEMLSLLLATGCIPIIHGMPPYEYWERPPAQGRLPENRTDVGIFLLAEVLGARSLIYVKDEDGLHSADPKKDPAAKLIPRISTADLKALELNDLIVERKVLDLMESAHYVRQVRVINGLVRGNLTRALAGEDVGTLIYVESASEAA